MNNRLIKALIIIGSVGAATQPKEELLYDAKAAPIDSIYSADDEQRDGSFTNDVSPFSRGGETITMLCEFNRHNRPEFCDYETRQGVIYLKPTHPYGEREIR